MQFSDFLVGLLSIILINIVLSGDNALVIALASRGLPPRQQQAAIIWGGAGAIGLRIILTFIAVFLLRIPYLQLVAGLALLWIAIKLLRDNHEAEECEAAGNLWSAVKTIIVADLVMSVDNVIAIAGVARGNTTLLVIGLAISIPIIIWGSKLIGTLMERWPVIITIGAAFLGWTAGDMVLADQKIAPFTAGLDWLHWAVPAMFAAAVILAGHIASREKAC